MLSSESNWFARSLATMETNPGARPHCGMKAELAPAAICWMRRALATSSVRSSYAAPQPPRLRRSASSNARARRSAPRNSRSAGEPRASPSHDVEALPFDFGGPVKRGPAAPADHRPASRDSRGRGEHFSQGRADLAGADDHDIFSHPALRASEPHSLSQTRRRKKRAETAEFDAVFSAI